MKDKENQTKLVTLALDAHHTKSGKFDSAWYAGFTVAKSDPFHRRSTNSMLLDMARGPSRAVRPQWTTRC